MLDSRKKYLGFISFAYGIGTILVVFGHSYPLGHITIPKTMLVLRSFLYAFHMPLFFLISGILMKYNHNEKNLCIGEYVIFIKKKAIKLLTPYFILVIVAFIPKYFVSQYVTDRVSLTADYFIRTFLVPRENVWGHLWFIPVLFILFCCSYLLLKSLQKTWLSILLTGIFIMLNFYPINIAWFGIKDICIYGIYFWIGILSSDFIISNQEKLFSVSTGICTAVSAIILVTSLPFLITVKITLKQVVFFLTALLMIHSIFSLGVMYQYKGHRYLEWMNEKIFTVFLLSWPCQSIVQILLNKILKLNYILVMPAMFLAGVAGPLIIWGLYKKLKINNKFLRIIVGIK